MKKEKLANLITKIFKGSLTLGLVAFMLLIIAIFAGPVSKDTENLMICFFILLGLLLLIWLVLFVAEIFYVIKYKDRSRLPNLFFILLIFAMSIWGYLKAAR